MLSPALKARLATHDKGQLMVRHPHFMQPMLMRFPRPAVLTAARPHALRSFAPCEYGG